MYILYSTSHDLQILRSVESACECVFVRLSHPTLPDPDPGVGVPVSSRVSTKIQQLLNTLKRPKRPPLSEFFMDDQEEIVEGALMNTEGIKHTLNKAAVMWIRVFLLPQFLRQILTPRSQKAGR